MSPRAKKRLFDRLPDGKTPAGPGASGGIEGGGREANPNAKTRCHTQDPFEKLIDDIRFRQDEVIGKDNLASAPFFFTEGDQKTL
jgi:hypothetical protein